MQSGRGGKRANSGGKRDGAGSKRHLLPDDLRDELKLTAEKYKKLTGKSVADCLMELIYGRPCAVCDGTGKITPHDDCDCCKGSGQMGADPKVRATALKTFLDTQIVKQSYQAKDINVTERKCGIVELPALDKEEDVKPDVH